MVSLIDDVVFKDALILSFVVSLYKFSFLNIWTSVCNCCGNLVVLYSSISRFLSSAILSTASLSAGDCCGLLLLLALLFVGCSGNSTFCLNLRFILSLLKKNATLSAYGRLMTDFG